MAREVKKYFLFSLLNTTRIIPMEKWEKLVLPLNPPEINLCYPLFIQFLCVRAFSSLRADIKWFFLWSVCCFVARKKEGNLFYGLTNKCSALLNIFSSAKKIHFSRISKRTFFFYPHHHFHYLMFTVHHISHATNVYHSVLNISSSQYILNTLSRPI